MKVLFSVIGDRATNAGMSRFASKVRIPAGPSIAIATLALVTCDIHAWAQAGKSIAGPAPSARVVMSSSAGGAGPTSTASVPSSGQPAPATPFVGSAPQPPTLADLDQKIQKLTDAVTANASSVSEPIKPADDIKSVILNIISNRLDAWLFGDGKGKAGIVAEFAAVIAFFVAFLRLLIAFAVLKRTKPHTKRDKFKIWLRDSLVVRMLNVFFGLLACVYTGAALYVVVSAQATGEVKSAIVALDASLKDCQSKLADILRQPQGATVPALGVPDGVPGAAETTERYAMRCQSAMDQANARLTEIQQQVDGIANKQAWAITKVFTFLAVAWVTSAVTGLFFRKVKG